MAVGCPLVAHFHVPFMPFFLFSNENWSISAASVLPTSTIRIYTVKAQLSVITHTVTEQSFRTHLPIDITWTQKPWALVFDSFSAINVKVLVWTKQFFFCLMENIYNISMDTKHLVPLSFILKFFRTNVLLKKPKLVIINKYINL